MVRISGNGFQGKLAVKFDETPATDVRLVGADILATAPAHAEGAVDVSVLSDANASKPLVKAFTYKASPPPQRSILLLVLLAGALGGTLHAIRSFCWYVGNRDLKWSWVPMYVFRPLTGAALACIFFMTLMVGIGVPQPGASPLWIVGVAALVGLFSPQGFEKLKMIFEALFTPAPKAADSIKPSSSTGLQVTALTPSLGPLGGNNKVALTGTGFTSGLKVRFGDFAATSVHIDGPTSAVAITPQHEAGDVDVVVETESGATKLAKGYTFTGVSPGQGKTTGGEIVTIAGPGFAGVTSVRFGAAEATEVTVGSLPTTLTAKTPAHAAGKVDVTILAGGTPVLVYKNGYEYLG